MAKVKIDDRHTWKIFSNQISNNRLTLICDRHEGHIVVLLEWFYQKDYAFQIEFSTLDTSN